MTQSKTAQFEKKIRIVASHLWQQGYEAKMYDAKGKPMLETRVEDIMSLIEQACAAEREEVRQDLYQLDWIHILKDAIETRTTSWSVFPVQEWRNASDQLLGAMITAAEEKGIFKSLKERLKHSLAERKEKDDS